MNRMTRLLEAATSVASSNPDVRRRGRILVTICLGILVILLTVGMGLTMLQPKVGRFINLSLAVMVFTLTYTLGRMGFVTPAAYLLLLLNGLGAITGIFLNPTSPFNMFYLILGILLASVLLPPRQIWVVLGFSLVAVASVLVAIPAEIRAAHLFNPALSHLTVILIASAFVSFIGARHLNNALREAEAARAHSEAVNRQLVEINATLEERVAKRTEQLRKLVEEQRATATQLAESLQAQQRLNQMFMEVSTPVIPVRDDTLVIPIIGNIDSQRVHNLFNTALQALEAHQARVLILDITGVAVMDTQVAAALIQVARATALMGAETILAGIRPEVAQTLVSLGTDLVSLRTTATLQTALEFTFNGRSQTPVRNGKL